MFCNVVVSIRSLFRTLVCIVFVMTYAITLLTNMRILSDYESCLAVKAYRILARIEHHIILASIDL